MSRQSLQGVLHHLRKLAAVQTCDGFSDRELLERFAQNNEETAFTVLVERHGPMVYGVCHRVLRNTHDAEDACQAVFLVLARKGGSIRKSTSLSSWLHGVAYRVASDLKRKQTRRQLREQQAGQATTHDPVAELTWQEAQTILDEELQRLPHRYRAPLILCYLDGKTRDETAQQLGLSPGTLHGQLERGRNLLRSRLTQRGLTLSAALFATVLDEGMTRAALAPTLVVSVTQRALAFASGKSALGLIPPRVLMLTQEVLKAMFMTKIKCGTAAILFTGVLATLLAGSVMSRGVAQEEKQPQPGKQLTTTPGQKESDADFIRRLSLDLRGHTPSPTEMHFFVASKDPRKRQQLIDLFIKERQARTEADEEAHLLERLEQARLQEVPDLSPARIRGPFNSAGSGQGKQAQRNPLLKEKWQNALEGYNQLSQKEGGTLPQNYLDYLMQFIKEHPKSKDVPTAMSHIVMVYHSQGKTVEADAWRAKLLKEYPASPAARSLQEKSKDPRSDSQFNPFGRGPSTKR